MALQICSGSKSLHAIIWILLIKAFFGVMFSYIECPPLVVLFTPSLILLFQMTLDLDKDVSVVTRLIYYFVAWILLSAAWWLATVDYLGVEPTIYLALLMIIVTFILNGLWIRLLDFCQSYKKGSIFSFMVITYPTMWTAFFVFFAMGPLATTFNTAINLWHYHDFAQIASIFGVNSLSFLHCWFTAIFCIFMYVTFVNAERVTIPKPQLHGHLMGYISLMVVVLLYGGFRLNVKHFWHQDPDLWRDNDLSLRGLCITQLSRDWQTQINDVELILTVEGWINKNNATGNVTYHQMKQYASDIATTYNHSVMVGIGIQDPNTLEFYVANRTGELEEIFIYQKGNPVPTMEDFEPRTMKPPVVDMAPYGFNFSLSAIICFDAAYPDWAIHAKNADLLLHPSYLWNSFMDMFLSIVSYRAIENGFNIFHCAEGGNTAAINTFGEVDFKHANNLVTSRLTITELSGYKDYWTVYSKCGFVFDYFMMGFGPLYWLLCILVAIKPDWARLLLGKVGLQEKARYSSCNEEEEDAIQGVES